MVREKIAVALPEAKVLISAAEPSHHEGWEGLMKSVELCILLETWPCGTRTLRTTEAMPRWLPHLIWDPP